jgi:hypothetical protein
MPTLPDELIKNKELDKFAVLFPVEPTILDFLWIENASLAL